MKKSDLKTGMIVTTSNGCEWVVMLDCDVERLQSDVLLELNSNGAFTGDWNSIENVNYDLKWDGLYDDYDIIKVQKGIINQNGELETIWERGESAKELTVAQIEELLGHKVKVVK